MTTPYKRNVAKTVTVKGLFVPLTNTKAVLFIIFIGLIVFSNSVTNGFVGDDNAQLINNPLVHGLTYIPQLFTGSTFYSGAAQLTGLWYRPLMLTVYAIIYFAFGLNAFPFHIFQLSIHILNTILIFLIFRYYFKITFSLLLSLLFLVHPLNSQTVSFMGNLDDILFFFFGILALFLQLTMKDGYKKLISISLLLILSLLSKESGALFIGVVLCQELIMRTKHMIKTATTVIGIFLMYVYLHFFIVHMPYSQSVPSAPITELSLLERIMASPAVIFYYIKSALLPLQPDVSQEWIINSPQSSGFYIAVFFDMLAILLIIFLGFSIIKKHKKYMYPYFFFTFWFCIGLLLYSQLLVALDFTVSDNWFYFPLAGLLGIIGVVAQVFFTKPKGRIIFYFTMTVIIALFSFRTILRNANFHDNFTLVSHDIQFSPDSAALNFGLGNQYLYQGQFKLANPYLSKAVLLDPKEGINWYTLALLYEQTGQTEKAKQAYQQALTYSNESSVYENYSLFLFMNHNLDLAMQITNKGIQKYPTDGQLWMVKSFIEDKNGRLNEAVTSAKYAQGYSPSNLTNTVYLLISRHLQFNIGAEWTNQGIAIGVKQM